MNKEIVTRIHAKVTSLQDMVDRILFSSGGGSTLTDLIDRMIEVGNVTLLYWSDLSAMELGTVESMLDLSTGLFEAGSDEVVTERINAATRVVEGLEHLYKEKRLLLGHETDEKIKCA